MTGTDALTIFAPATAPGRAGVAVLRLSGPLAFIEALIDFSDDELPENTLARGLAMIRSLRDDLAALAGLAGIGCRVRRAAAVAVVGPPNAGKPSLVNRLAGWDVAIFSPTPGTTRDRVSVALVLRGIPLSITDAAGLRIAPEDIEAEGIRRAERAVANADIRLAVFSAEAWPATNAPPGRGLTRLRWS